MANPYTNVSITGYNANPPPDDGSQTSTNEISWAKHKLKLTDPLKDAIESIDTNVSAAFDDRSFNAVSSKSTNYTVVDGDRGALISASNAITLTLPSASTVGSGWAVHVYNSGSGVVTVDGENTETINGDETIDIVQGDGAILVSGGGSSWTAIRASFYSEEDVELGEDFDAGEMVTCARIGNLVTITAKGALTHASDSAPDSTTGVIPARYRPAGGVAVVYTNADPTRRVLMFTNGTLSTVYVDFTGSLSADTSTGTGFCLTYTV